MIKFKRFISISTLIAFLLLISIFMTGCDATVEGVKKFLSGFFDMFKKIFQAVYSKLSAIMNNNNNKPVPDNKTPVEGSSQTTPGENQQPAEKPNKKAPDFVSTWGDKGVKPGFFNTPIGIAVDNDDNVYVADSDNCRIQKFTSDGKFLNAFGKRGSDIGELDKPYGLAITDIGDIYISDNQNSRIVRIDGQGQFLSAKCNDGSQLGELHQPIGITFDQEGNIYVADSGNHRIQKLNYESLQNNTAYSKSGTLQKQTDTSDTNINNPWNSHFPQKNEGPNTGQFTTPWDVLLTPSGDVIVVDTFNHRLQKFSPNGDFINQWGQVGHDNGQFQFPTFASVDKYGFILVVDTGNHRVQKFTQEGEFLAKWGEPGNDQEQLNQPHGIAVSPKSGDIYVADTENNRIQRYTYRSWTERIKEGLWKKKTPTQGPGKITPGNTPTPKEVIF